MGQRAKYAIRCTLYELAAEDTEPTEKRVCRVAACPAGNVGYSALDVQVAWLFVVS